MVLTLSGRTERETTLQLQTGIGDYIHAFSLGKSEKLLSPSITFPWPPLSPSLPFSPLFVSLGRLCVWDAWRSLWAGARLRRQGESGDTV